MSTRTQLRFVNGDRTAQVYNHSDGYPSSILRTLDELADLLDATRWQRGAAYTAAQFILVRKMRGLQAHGEKLAEYMNDDEIFDDANGWYVDNMKESLQNQDGVGPARADAAARMAVLITSPAAWQNLRQPYFLGGHGVETGNIHGDEAYIYEVHVGDHSDSTDWHVKISNEFESPQWETRSGEKRGYDYGEDEDAWSECTWAVEGHLSTALELLDEADAAAEDGDVHVDKEFMRLARA